jgi:uncharacterized protein
MQAAESSSPTFESACAQPTREQDRLLTIDAARGLALLGILMVNIQSFAQPFGEFMIPRPDRDDLVTQVCFYVQKILCEGKFFPLFSMLFGMGLVLQMRSLDRARAAGEPRSFIRIYLRRLAVLLMFGLVHALVFWYGDILFMYAIAGAVLMLFARLSGRALLIMSIAMLSAATFIGGPLGGLMMAAQPPTPPPGSTAAADAAPVFEVLPGAMQSPVDGSAVKGAPGQPARPRDGLDDLAERSPFFRLMNEYRDQKIAGGPEHPRWMEAEREAFRDGPWLDAFLFRVTLWLFYLVFSMFGFGWIVLGMFFLGAALLKLDFFAAARRPLRRRLVLVGMVVGMPCAIAAVHLAGNKGSFLAAAGSMMLVFLAAPLVSLLYLSGMSLIVESGRLPAVTRRLGATGRMALTNYLTHTVVCTFIFYHWGLGQFDQWSRGQQVALVLAIFAAQLVISPLWLSRFRFGPMEWLWRTLTYGKWQPMRRAGVGEG